MASPLPRIECALTGALRVRRTWLDKLLLQVEVRVDRIDSTPGIPRSVLSTSYFWRDAKTEDALHWHQARSG